MGIITTIVISLTISSIIAVSLYFLMNLKFSSMTEEIAHGKFAFGKISRIEQTLQKHDDILERTGNKIKSIVEYVQNIEENMVEYKIDEEDEEEEEEEDNAMMDEDEVSTDEITDLIEERPSFEVDEVKDKEKKKTVDGSPNWRHLLSNAKVEQGNSDSFLQAFSSPSWLPKTWKAMVKDLSLEPPRPLPKNGRFAKELEDELKTHFAEFLSQESSPYWTSRVVNY